MRLRGLAWLFISLVSAKICKREIFPVFLCSFQITVVIFCKFGISIVVLSSQLDKDGPTSNLCSACPLIKIITIINVFSHDGHAFHFCSIDSFDKSTIQYYTHLKID